MRAQIQMTPLKQQANITVADLLQKIDNKVDRIGNKVDSIGDKVDSIGVLSPVSTTVDFVVDSVASVYRALGQK